jgi:V/A-type H+-transporting ATPase subunit A
MTNGVVTRVNGALVEAEGLADTAMFEVVEIGGRRLPGEVVGIRDGVLTIQCYEYTGGVRPGDVVSVRGEPLSVPLGPGLLGGVFDGLLRPLSGAGVWLEPRPVGDPASGRTWRFEPSVTSGATVAEGDVVGHLEPRAALPCAVLSPPGVSGVVEEVAPAGEYAADARLARIAGVDLPLVTRWPLRRPRPFRERLRAATPLRTWERGRRTGRVRDGKDRAPAAGGEVV